MSISITLSVSNLTRIVVQPNRITLETVQVRAAWYWTPEIPIRRSLPAWNRVY
jgi:hypothetical protein